MQRLDKFLAEAGVDSRRKLRDMVRSGRVTVNGSLVLSPEQKIDETRDVICVDGQRIGRGDRRIVLMLHKPAGCVTAARDDRYPTVMEHLPPQYAGLMPIGRLDKDTEGLLLFTNDGDLAHRLLAPKRRNEKTYYAEHTGNTDGDDVAAFRAGCVLRDGTQCLPAILKPLGEGKSMVRVCEGKYHQVRRMLASRGKTVTYLRRVAEGGVELGALPLGMTRELTESEIEALESVDFDENS